MDKSKSKSYKNMIQSTMENLKKNGINSYYVESADKVCEKVKELLTPGEVIGVGGSITLNQTGVIDLVKNGEYAYLDRHKAGITDEEIKDIFKKSFSADTYISSSNAITINGELYNVDGTSNRVGAICYGPQSVIIIAGVNKIVADINSAIKRVKQIAAPANCVRLNKKTFCAEKGYCQGLHDPDMTAGCETSERICKNYLVTAKQSQKGRIKVILVNEDLGL